MNIEVKSGPYGKYLEWTNEENEICRVALKEFRLRDLTEKQYEELIKTRKLSITIVEEDYKYIVGYKTIDIKLKDYISKKDGKRHYIIETDSKIIKDTSKISTFLETYEVTAETIDKIIKEAEHALKSLDLASKEFIRVERRDIRQVSEKLYLSEISVIQEYKEHRTILDEVCYLITDEDDAIIEVFKDVKLWRKYAEESRNYKVAIEKQKEIEEIMSKPWKEVYLQEVYDNAKELVDSGWNYEDSLEKLTTLINENYAGKDLSYIVAWEVRAIGYWENNSHRTNQSSGGSVYHVRNILPKCKEFIYGYYQNWTDVYLKEVNLDYDKSVEYILRVDARPTD